MLFSTYFWAIFSVSLSFSCILFAARIDLLRIKLNIKVFI